MTDTDRTPNAPISPAATTPRDPRSGRDQHDAFTRPDPDPQAQAQADIPAQAGIPTVEQAIALREQAPELYDLWLRIAQEKAATASYVERAPYEVPERLAQTGRPRALGALVIVLSFCGYLAWLGGPGPYIGGLIAVLDLAVMFGMFFGLRPERLPEVRSPRRLPPPGRGRLRCLSSASSGERPPEPPATATSRPRPVTVPVEC
jgi:hypothetical protein